MGALKSALGPVMPHPAASTVPVARDTGTRPAYLRAVTEEILGWSNPRHRLQQALAEDGFLLYAQPIHALKPEPGDAPCLEILLRLQEEEDHLLPPGGFFPVAEALGMLEHIDRWVVRNTVTWCAQTEVRLRSPVCCINLSSNAVRNPEFAGFVRAQINAAGIPGHCLCFEICEQDVIEYPQETRGIISNLQPKGCRFTLDHFGSVRMSFAHLRNLPINYLKVDSSILYSAQHGPGELARARAISATCQKLSIRLVATHVEQRMILAKLVGIGCNYAQGFDIAQPAPLSDLSIV